MFIKLQLLLSEKMRKRKHLPYLPTKKTAIHRTRRIAAFSNSITLGNNPVKTLGF